MSLPKNLCWVSHTNDCGCHCCVVSTYHRQRVWFVTAWVITVPSHSQVSIWVLGISAFLGNLFVIVWRIRTDASKASSFFVINLGCSDFLMGLYLLIIGSVDAHYRGVYIVHADAWRSSNLCQAAGFLAMLSRFVCREGYAKDDIISVAFVLQSKTVVIRKQLYVWL